MKDKIKDRLAGDIETIRSILEELGCTNIKLSNGNKDYRFGTNEVGSGSGNLINIETLSYKSFSNDKGGDIFNLVMDRKGIEFKDSLRWLANYLHMPYKNSQPKPVRNPFGRLFNMRCKLANNEYNCCSINYKKYSIDILNDFKSGYCGMWLKEGISTSTQDKFNIGYDSITKRITVPWIDSENNIVGVVGRLNKEIIEEYENKYMPILDDFKKSYFLYGLCENKDNIKETSTMIICEAEKSVLKADSMGYNNVVALGGNSISQTQANLILSLRINNIIIALDSDMSIEHCKKQANKLKLESNIKKSNIYILDMHNEIIKDEKMAIFDYNKDIVDKVLNDDKYLIKVV